MKRFVLWLCFVVALVGCAHVQPDHGRADLVDQGGSYGAEHRPSSVDKESLLHALALLPLLLPLAVLRAMDQSNFHYP